jgi:hypothetical protein
MIRRMGYRCHAGMHVAADALVRWFTASNGPHHTSGRADDFCDARAFRGMAYFGQSFLADGAIRARTPSVPLPPPHQRATPRLRRLMFRIFRRIQTHPGCQTRSTPAAFAPQSRLQFVRKKIRRTFGRPTCTPAKIPCSMLWHNCNLLRSRFKGKNGGSQQVD